MLIVIKTPVCKTYTEKVNYIEANHLSGIFSKI